MLKGQRLTLRAREREDLPRLHQFFNDMEVELLGGSPSPRPSSLASLQAEFDEDNKPDKRRDRLLADFVIEADGKCIGTCGLWRYRPASGVCELGIGIGDREYWGRGYGREAIGLLLDYAFRIHNVRRVCLNTSSANERALRCYRACGFVEEGRLRQHEWIGGQYVDEVQMGILRDEYEAKGQ